MKKFIDFIKEAYDELKKVTWPSKDELKESTLVVIISTILISIFLGIVDIVVAKIIKMVIR